MIYATLSRAQSLGGRKSYFSIISTISRSLSERNEPKWIWRCLRFALFSFSSSRKSLWLGSRAQCGYKCLLFELPCKYWICSIQLSCTHSFVHCSARSLPPPTPNETKNVFQGEGFQLPSRRRRRRRSAFSNSSERCGAIWQWCDRLWNETIINWIFERFKRRWRN